MAATRTTDVCIAGGGPAGLMLGYLLARADIQVLVLEKHADFLRDFRGDTVHPSTLEVMHELGLLEEFLNLPHQKVSRLVAHFGDEAITIANFQGLALRCPYIAMMPQWDLLNFLAEKGRDYPSFSLLMQAEAEDLIYDGAAVTGVRVATKEGLLEVKCKLVVGADGRGSVLRTKSGLAVEDFGAPIDVVWFRMPREAGDTGETQARFGRGHLFIMLNRGDYWQCAYVIAKGSFEKVRQQGLDAFRKKLQPLLPVPPERADAIQSFDDLKLLTVQINRMPVWHKPGLLFIGDAAHAMSPVGGVGINLAVQDAVAAANILAGPLRNGRLAESDLAAVQERRLYPARTTQSAQVMFQNRIILPALNSSSHDGPLPPPFFARVIKKVPYLSRYPARMIGLGVRPEHVSAAITGAAAA